MKSNKGFSLVELIVVIAIMAIIAGVAIPVYTTYIDKTNKASDEQLFADIQDVLTYALVADTEGTLGNGIIAVIGENGLEAATDSAVYDILTEAELANIGLKYDGWSSSEISKDVAEAIVNSNYFSDSSAVGGMGTNQKVDELLQNVQDLSNAYSGIVGTSGNQAVFDLSENISALSPENVEELVYAWKTEGFAVSGAMDILKRYEDCGVTSGVTNLALYYANAKAMVQYMVNYRSETYYPGSTVYDTHTVPFLATFNSFTTSLTPETGTTEEVDEAVALDLMGVINSMFGIVASAAGTEFYTVLDDYLQYDGEDDKTREYDARAFIATLDIATEYAGNLDVNQEDLFISDEVKGYVKDQITSMDTVNFSEAVAGADGKVVIVVTKNSDGSFTYVQYK